MKTLALALFLTPLAVHAELIALKGARVIEGTAKPPIDNAVLIVKDEFITGLGPAKTLKVPEGARVIDVKGRTIMPGIVNAHGHVGLVAHGKNSADAYTRENVLSQLLQYEKFGVTAVCSLGLNRDLVYEIRDEQRAGNTIPGATLLTAGRGIGVPDAAPPVPVAPDQVYRPKTPEEAVEMVKETMTHHPDLIKIWVDDVYEKFPKMTPDIYKAVIEEAHAEGARVAAHVFYLADAKALAAAGVDAFAHSIRDKPVDGDLIKVMIRESIDYIPTLTVDESAFIFAEDPSLLKDPMLAAAAGPETMQMLKSPEYKRKVESDPNTPKIKAAFAMAKKNLKTLSDAGVRIAFGTDSGAQPVRIPGWAEHRELWLMVKAGLTPLQAIKAATNGAANVAGVSRERGTIEVGKRADFLVLAADPTKDIRNTRKILQVWHDGREMAPAVAAK
ncbi:MAG TPA: amidohydrolase family protein [Myxococcales bacterium]|jgi:imidazolonepropionase-like amidohydrolase